MSTETAKVDPCVMCGEPSGAASLSMFILNDSVTGRTWGGVSPGHLRLCEECVWKLDEIGATAISRAIRGSMVDLTEGRGPQVMEELRFHVSLLQSGAAHNKHNCNSCWTLWALEAMRSEIDFARQLANGVYPDELANQFGGMGLEDRPLGKAIADLHLEIAALRGALEEIKKSHFGKTRGWDDLLICVRCGEPFPCPDFKIAQEAQGEAH